MGKVNFWFCFAFDYQIDSGIDWPKKVNFLFRQFIDIFLLFARICFPFSYVLYHLLTGAVREKEIIYFSYKINLFF